MYMDVRATSEQPVTKGVPCRTEVKVVNRVIGAMFSLLLNRKFPRATHVSHVSAQLHAFSCSRALSRDSACTGLDAHVVIECDARVILD